MNTIDFCFWLQGYFELSESNALSDKQVQVIKSHLNLVFKHEIDPLRESETSTPKEILNATHVESGTFGLIQKIPSNKTGNNDELIRC